MTGNLSSLPKTRFLLDESLDPAVSKALNLVGYQFAETPKGAKDPHIIEWCRERTRRCGFMRTTGRGSSIVRNY